MKDVTIISKVVGRKEGDRPVTGGGSQAAVDLSAYLLKKTWDTAWELREKDGVPYLFGKLPVVLQSGMTSYVADEAVDLPGIYDGLPIDGDTLYWVLDENGKKVMLKSKGGDEEGGGSVKFPLYWDGCSKGSWDGSEAKTIMLPSKLSDLENDGFFKDFGWTGSDANEQCFGSYLYGGVANSNTPIDTGQLIAFNSNEGGYRGYQMFMHGQNYYFRQHWDNEWKVWRKVISGNVDGVIDYSLTIDGRLFVYDNINLRGQEGGDIEFVFNPNGSITNIKNGGSIAIRHALRFKWYGDSYEIGAVRGGGAESRGFGVTYGNHTLIFEVGVGFCDFHTLVNIRKGLFVQGNVEFADYVKFVKPTNFTGNAGQNDISFVYNEDGVISNKTHDAESIRHALRFQWFKDAYEIGAVRTSWDEAFGFGVTYNNNQLVWKVNKERMDVYGDLRIKNGLIKYHENDELFYFGGKLDSLTIASLQQQLNGLWKRNWFEDLYATMIMADNASFERLYGDSIIIGDCKLSYDYEKGTLVIQKFDGTDTNVVISGGLTAYSTEV